MKRFAPLLLLLLSGPSFWGQDTTKVLFVGNSFTYFNNMPQMVQSLADSAIPKIPMMYAMHAPGGVSVGDTAQGSMAHMNNPVLYTLIRSKKWDVVVIQDNQGRFVRDSAQFPGSSKVVEGHLRIMDSVKVRNSCAKIVLFGGWGFQTGQPPYGNTGVEMIRRILRNYVVLNDTMKEVIAPIGEAWIKVVNYFPSVNLWGPDQAHPAAEGSYLTASVIFSTIFNRPAKGIGFSGGITGATTAALRTYADSVIFNAGMRSKYNLGGMAKLDLSFSGGQFSVTGPGPFYAYKWYRNKTYIGKGITQAIAGNGNYTALVKQSDSCWVKTCAFDALTLSMPEEGALNRLRLFPNPVAASRVTLEGCTGHAVEIWIISADGSELKALYRQTGDRILLDITNLAPGCYTVRVNAGGQVKNLKLLVTGSPF